MRRLFNRPRINGEAIIIAAAQEAVNKAHSKGFEEGYQQCKAEQSKLPLTLTVDISDDVKNAVNNLKEELEHFKTNSQSFAILEKTASESAPVTELLELGQWVFEGQDDKWIGAAVDDNGSGYLYTCNSSEIHLDSQYWYVPLGHIYKPLPGKFDATDWDKSFIDRYAINDVKFDENETRQDFENDQALNDGFITTTFADLTQQDLSIIFIQNLTTILLQRMNSLNRYSESDKIIDSDSAESWDAIVDITGGVVNYGVLIKGHRHTLAFLEKPVPFETTSVVRTIYEAEKDEWRQAMERRYV